MQPDEATLRQILDDSALLEGFNDPAVMAAVQEIAEHPEALSKHAENAQVSAVHCTLAMLSFTWWRALQGSLEGWRLWNLCCNAPDLRIGRRVMND